MVGPTPTRPRTRPRAADGRVRRRSGTLVLLLLSVLGMAHAAPKTDIVVLKNGDHITGEIKKLERGLLTVKTDAMGTLSIEWPHVESIQTRQLLEIEQVDGARSYGHATDPSPIGTVRLGNGDEKAPQAPLPLESIVLIAPISEGDWWSHVDGNVSVGISAASANDNRQLTASASMTYRTANRSWTLDYSGARTESANNPVSERQNLDGVYRWLRANRWFWAAAGSMTTNDEMDLVFRSLAGGGIGRYWMHNPQHEFSTLGALVLSRENYRDAGNHQSVEAMLGASYDFFHFDDPDIDLSASLALFPSLSVSGRLRSEFSLSFRFELIKDLYYELGYSRSHDSKPPNTEAAETDWSLTSSLGYKF